MRDLKEMELGVLFWSTEDPQTSLRFVRQFGLKAAQIGFGGELDLDTATERWQAALAQDHDLSIATAVCSYAGEDYTDVAAVQRTVGLIPEATRAQRIARTKSVADIAAKLGVLSVACHIGFVPEDRGSAGYVQIRDVVREICDYVSTHKQSFALETGQETAEALLSFIEDVSRPNLKVNFDPANMIMYGTGDPIDALRVLAAHVISVHCKDGAWPGNPGALGVERPLGSGAVDFPQFLATLRAFNYRGILSIEREEQDAVRRTEDIHHAVKFLTDLLGSNAVVN